MDNLNPTYPIGRWTSSSGTTATAIPAGAVAPSAAGLAVVCGPRRKDVQLATPSATANPTPASRPQLGALAVDPGLMARRSPWL